MLPLYVVRYGAPESYSRHEWKKWETATRAAVAAAAFGDHGVGNSLGWWHSMQVTWRSKPPTIPWIRWVMRPGRLAWCSNADFKAFTLAMDFCKNRVENCLPVFLLSTGVSLFLPPQSQSIVFFYSSQSYKSFLMSVLKRTSTMMVFAFLFTLSDKPL